MQNYWRKCLIKEHASILPTVDLQVNNTSKNQTYNITSEKADDYSGMLFANLFDNESCLNDKYPEDIVKSVDDRFNETDLKIKRIEDKLQTVLNKLMTEFNELKGQSLICTNEKPIQIHDKHVNIGVSNKSEDVVDSSNNTVIDNHDSPVRVNLSTDEEIATNQTSHQHTLKRKYKSKKKLKTVKPLVSSSVGDKIKETDKEMQGEQACANDSLSKSTQTTQSITTACTQKGERL